MQRAAELASPLAAGDGAELRRLLAEASLGELGLWRPGVTDLRVARASLMAELLALLPDRHGRALHLAFGADDTPLTWPGGEEGGSVVRLELSSCSAAEGGVADPQPASLDPLRARVRDGSFEVVVCIEPSARLDSREELLDEALRVLAPGGWFVVSDVVAREADGRPRETTRAAPRGCDTDAYGRSLRAAGFVDVRVRDVTQECCVGRFWSVVHRAHEAFLGGEIDRAHLDRTLGRLYALLPEVAGYVLAAGRRPRGPVS